MSYRSAEIEDNGRVKRQKMDDKSDPNSWLPGSDEVDGGVRLDGYSAAHSSQRVKNETSYKQGTCTQEESSL